MPVVSVFLIIFAASHLWAAFRLQALLRGCGVWRVLLPLLILLLMVDFPLAYASRSTAPWVILLDRIGTFWIAFFAYGLFTGLALDLFRLFNRRFGWFPALDGRRNPRVRGYALGALLLVPTLVCGLGWLNAANPIVREVALDIPVKEDRPPLTLAVLTDTHLGRVISAERFEAMMAKVGQAKPDAVLFVGDMLDDHIALDVPAMRRAVDGVGAPLGVWGVLGNHEYISGPVEDSLDILKRSGIRILRDDWVALGGVLLVGRDDYSKPRFTGTPRAGLEEILAAIPGDERGDPMILLDHQPQKLEEAERAGIALQLSGHTHYGQLWPFQYVVKQVYENAAGYSRRGQTQYWVSVGAGAWGPAVRTNARPEILILRLSFVKAS
ncbi:MAG: metallophosphoesterase [Rhodospirillaceae bacterium]|nr:metallophosphoesterase [Rhodospirillaceae bacterium]